MTQAFNLVSLYSIHIISINSMPPCLDSATSADQFFILLLLQSFLLSLTLLASLLCSFLFSLSCSLQAAITVSVSFLLFLLLEVIKGRESFSISRGMSNEATASYPLFHLIPLLPTPLSLLPPDQMHRPPAPFISRDRHSILP